jgi:hypothetical protein
LATQIANSLFAAPREATAEPIAFAFVLELREIEERFARERPINFVRQLQGGGTVSGMVEQSRVERVVLNG